MKHVQQGDNECVLATLAMLAEIDIERAREIAADVAGVNRKDFDWWSIFQPSVAGRGDGCPYILEIAHAMNLDIDPVVMVGAIPSGTLSHRIVGFVPAKPNLTGKGQVSILGDILGGGHSMAYENGKIYDPGLVYPQKCSWKTIVKRYGVTKFVVTPIK